MADEALARAIVLALDADALNLLADRLAPRLQARVIRDQGLGDVEDEWLDSKRAAAYLGLSLDAIHKKTAARSIPFEQDGPGCKCWFRRSEVDLWRSDGGARRRLA